MFENDYNSEKYPVECTVFELKHIQPHYHPDQLVLIYCINGEVEFSTGSTRGRIKADEILFINKNEIHYLFSDSENDVLVVHIDVPDGTFYKKGNIFPEKTQTIEEIKDCMLTLAFMDNVADIYEYDEGLALCNKLRELAIKYFEVKIEGKNDQIIQKILYHINNYYNQVITAEQLAEGSGYSAKYITSLFKKAGVGRFFEYLTYIRCVNADIMLYNEQHKIQDISEDCGFTSRKLFHRHFTVFSGSSPKQRQIEYRRLNNFKSKRNIFYGDHHICQTVLTTLGRRALTKVRKLIVNETVIKELED